MEGGVYVYDLNATNSFAPFLAACLSVIEFRTPFTEFRIKDSHTLPHNLIEFLFCQKFNFVLPQLWSE